MADNTSINQDTLGKLLAEDTAALQADIMAMVVDGYKNRPGGDGKEPDEATKIILGQVVSVMAGSMHTEAVRLKNDNQLDEIDNSQLAKKLLVAASNELNRVKDDPILTSPAEVKASAAFALAGMKLPGFVKIITGVDGETVSADADAYKALTSKLQPSPETVTTIAQKETRGAESGEALYGAQSNDYLQPYLDDAYVEKFIQLDTQARELFEQSKQTRAQQQAIIKADEELRASYEKYKQEKPVLVTENEGAVQDILRASQQSVEDANKARRDLAQATASLSPQMIELREKIDAYIKKKADGNTVTEDELDELNKLLEALPSSFASYSSQLAALKTASLEAPKSSTALKELVDPTPPAPIVAIGSENDFYVEAKKQFTAGGTGGIAAIYAGFASEAGEDKRRMLLVGLSNPSIGEVALAGWPEGKQRYAAPGNPQGAIAAALEVAIDQENQRKGELRRTVEENIPFAKNVTEQLSATLGNFVTQRGLDNVSGIIYQASLEGFAEAGLDPAKKGTYTPAQLEAATKIIAAKVRTALLTDKDGNRITDSNSVMVVDALTGVTTDGSGIGFTNHYGMNLAGVYEALITAEYGSETAKTHFQTGATQYLAMEKAKAQAEREGVRPTAGGGTTSLVSAYALFVNKPELIDEMLRIVSSGDPEADTKIASLIGQGGKLAQEMSQMLTEAGVDVSYGQAQTAIDRAIAPAIVKTLENYGGALQSGKILPYNQIVDIASEAGMSAYAKLAALGPTQVGALASPQVLERFAGVYDESDGSTLSVGSMVAALFAARSGDPAAKRTVFGQAMRGAADEGLPEVNDIVDGVGNLFVGTLPNGMPADTANQLVTAAMVNARENAQADGLARLWERICDFFAVLCSIATTDYSLGDFGTLMAQRDQNRFEQRYAANLRGIPANQLGGYSAEQIYNVSLARVYEQRAGVSREDSLALRFNNESAAQQQYAAAPQGAGQQQQIPGLGDGQAMLYSSNDPGALRVTQVDDGLNIPENVKAFARQAAARGNTSLWQDQNGDGAVTLNEIKELDRPALMQLGTQRGGIEIV